MTAFFVNGDNLRGNNLPAGCHAQIDHILRAACNGNKVLAVFVGLDVRALTLNFIQVPFAYKLIDCFAHGNTADIIHAADAGPCKKIYSA